MSNLFNSHSLPLLLLFMGIRYYFVPHERFGSSVPHERVALFITASKILPYTKEQVKKWFIKEAKMIRTNTFIDDWLEEAFERGFQQGIQQGIKEYQQQFLLGQLITRRELILKLLVLRFDPPVSYYQQTQQLLGDIDDLTTLRTIFATAVRSETLADLQAALSE